MYVFIELVTRDRKISLKGLMSGQDARTDKDKTRNDRKKERKIVEILNSEIF